VNELQAMRLSRMRDLREGVAAGAAERQKEAEICGKSGDKGEGIRPKIMLTTAHPEDTDEMATYTPANVSRFLVVKNQLEETRRKYKEEIERLEKEVEKERKTELESVIAEVKATIKRYDLTARDLGLSARTGKHKAKSVKAPPNAVRPVV
jgi:hypothetical protein